MELGLAADPYPEYARLRAAGPLVPAGPGTFAVPGYHEVAALLDDPRVSHRFPDAYRRFALGAGETADLLQGIVSSQEPPVHATARARLADFLHRAADPAWWDWARERTDATVRTVVHSGRFDAVTDLGAPLATELTAGLFGLPPKLLADAAILGRAFTALRLCDADRVAADAAVRRARTVFASDDRAFLCFTAVEMLTAAIATVCAVLPAHPDQLARVRAEPSLVNRAVGEILRFDPPTQGTARLVTAPIDVAGQPVRPGRVLFLLLGSANRDERVFADPDRLDVARDPNPHLAFGGGPYRCLGAALATRVTATVLERLLVHKVSAAAPPRRHPVETFCRSYASVVLRAEPRKETA
jgi:cytochrome P450